MESKHLKEILAEFAALTSGSSLLQEQAPFLCV